MPNDCPVSWIASHFPPFLYKIIPTAESKFLFSQVQINRKAKFAKKKLKVKR